MKKIKTSQSKAPIEIVIPLLDPVRIYTALELRDMPLSVMNAAIEAQEKYFLLETTTQMGGASNNSASIDARRREINSSQRKISNSLQNQKRVCRATYCPSVGKTWFGQSWGGVK